jgi:hypothetical protein
MWRVWWRTSFGTGVNILNLARVAHVPTARTLRQFVTQKTSCNFSGPAPLTIVTFDVAVSAEASDSTKSGAKVQVASSAERQTDLTRVQFCIRLRGVSRI